MKSQLQEICECCGEPITGARYIASAVGLVDAECAGMLRDAVKQLQKAGFRNVVIDPRCPDNKPNAGGAK